MKNPSHETFMERCLELATKSQQSGDLPFGAVVVAHGKIISEGCNTGLSVVTGHAEVHAIQQALTKHGSENTEDWILYTNMEPCAMCSFIVRDYGIGTVVFGSSSPYWGGFTRWNILSDTNLETPYVSAGNALPPKVIKHILKNKCDSLFDSLQWKMHK